MRLKFGPRQNDWQCFFCCHVRTGTIVFGIWHLLLHVMALSVIAVVLRHPELVTDDDATARDSILSTPRAEVEGLRPPEYPDLQASSNFHAPATLYAYGTGRKQVVNYQSLNVGVVVTFCTFLITLLMVHGAVSGKPSHLMPFFCLQVFDFCITSLTAVGYLFYPPDLRRLVERNPHVPFKAQLLDMNLQCLSLLALCLFLLMMTIKAYVIHMVWMCYKYLSLRQAVQQRTIHYIDPDNQTLLADLPDYETAVGDPRFQLKKPAVPSTPPPPSYASVAAATHPPPPPPPPAPAPASSVPATLVVASPAPASPASTRVA